MDGSNFTTETGYWRVSIDTYTKNAPRDVKFSQVLADLKEEKAQGGMRVSTFEADDISVLLAGDDICLGLLFENDLYKVATKNSLKYAIHVVHQIDNPISWKRDNGSVFLGGTTYTGTFRNPISRESAKTQYGYQPNGYVQYYTRVFVCENSENASTQSDPNHVFNGQTVILSSLNMTDVSSSADVILGGLIDTNNMDSSALELLSRSTVYDLTEIENGVRFGCFDFPPYDNIEYKAVPVQGSTVASFNRISGSYNVKCNADLKSMMILSVLSDLQLHSSETVLAFGVERADSSNRTKLVPMHIHSRLSDNMIVLTASQFPGLSCSRDILNSYNEALPSCISDPFQSLLLRDY